MYAPVVSSSEPFPGSGAQFNREVARLREREQALRTLQQEVDHMRGNLQLSRELAHQAPPSDLLRGFYPYDPNFVTEPNTRRFGSYQNRLPTSSTPATRVVTTSVHSVFTRCTPQVQNAMSYGAEPSPIVTPRRGDISCSPHSGQHGVTDNDAPSDHDCHSQRVTIGDRDSLLAIPPPQCSPRTQISHDYSRKPAYLDASADVTYPRQARDVSPGWGVPTSHGPEPSERPLGFSAHAGLAPTTWPEQRPRTKIKKTPEFDGHSSWRDYFTQFEMVAELNGWDDDTKALELATSLRGVAQGILSDLSAAERRSFRHLVAALGNRFEPEHQTAMYKAQIRNRKRRRGESLMELAQDIKKLVRKAYPTADLGLHETLAKDCFVDALDCREQEWSVVQCGANTIDEALRYALEFEAFHNSNRRSVAAASSQSNWRPALDRVTTRDTASLRDDRGATSDDSQVCFYCKQPGHYIRDCKRRLRAEARRISSQISRPGTPLSEDTGSESGGSRCGSPFLNYPTT